MFKKLVSTVFACALLVNAASAQTDAQVLAALSNMTNEELSQVAQDVKALVEADARAKGMNEEQVAAEVAKISTTVASLGTPQLGTLTKKESKIAYIVIGLASAGVLVLGYKFVWPWVKSKFSKDEPKKAITEDSKKSKKADKHKGHDHAKDAKADDSKKTVADKADSKAKDKAPKADASKKAADKAPKAKAKAPAKGKKAAAVEVSDDEVSDDEEDVTVEESEETEEETPAKARAARAKARKKA